MARPQSPNYDRRREGIIAAAAHLYARQGFQGASLADLAKACNTSKSLVYHYFPSKEDILYEVMASHLEQLLSAAEKVVMMNGAGPQEKLREIARSFMRLYSGAADSHKVLLNELDNLPPERRADVVSKQRRIIAIVEDQIGEIKPDLQERVLTLALTMLFFGMINWTHTWLKPDGSISPQRLADIAADLMISGIDGLQAS